MIRSAMAFVLVAAASANPAQAQPVVRVLGIDLGAKYAVGGVCSIDGKPPSRVCWVDRPFRYKGAQLGMVMLPHPETRPLWASYGPFDIHISAGGRLDSDALKKAAPKEEIASSIKGRFGAPSTVTNIPEKGIHAAEWIAPGLVVKLLCAESRDCSIEFVTAANEAARLKEVETREGAHPRTP